MLYGQTAFEKAQGENEDTILTMVDPQWQKVGKAYGDLQKRMTELHGSEMCWPVDWFPEKVGTENAPGSAIHFQLQHTVSPASCVDGGQWPPPDPSEVPKEDVLIFCDSYGFCKEIVQQAPPGRIGVLRELKKAATAYDDKTVTKHIKEHKWDLIVFGLSIDLPDSNSVEDIHKQQDAIMKMLLCIFKLLADDSTLCKRFALLTCDIFALEKDIHEEIGLGLITNSTLFGFLNTARTEVQTTCLHIDTEWALRSENTKYLVAEIFRHQSFGHNAVRILNRGRFVQRLVPCKPYIKRPEWPLPDDGIIGISGGNGALGLVMGLWILKTAKKQGGKRFCVQFLSRSMKVNDQNMPNWREIESLAEELGIKVEHKKCDVSSRESVDQYIADVTPNLTGFIHSAGVLQDAMMMNQTWEKFDNTFDPKSRAAMYIHDALERNDNPRLHFFWMFSSAAVYGNMGQLPYSASNAMLDGIARHRRALGKPAMAPQWGAWGDVGMAANLDDASRRRMANSPYPYFSNAEGLYGLECGLRTGLAYFEVKKVKMEICFGMIMPDDMPAQCYVRNHSSIVFPPPPSDPQKNPYTTLAYTTRKSNHEYHKGLVYQNRFPKLAEQEEYEEE